MEKFYVHLHLKRPGRKDRVRCRGCGTELSLKKLHAHLLEKCKSGLSEEDRRIVEESAHERVVQKAVTEHINRTANSMVRAYNARQANPETWVHPSKAPRPYFVSIRLAGQFVLCQHLQ